MKKIATLLIVCMCLLTTGCGNNAIYDAMNDAQTSSVARTLELYVTNIENVQFEYMFAHSGNILEDGYQLLENAKNQHNFKVVEIILNEQGMVSSIEATTEQFDKKYSCTYDAKTYATCKVVK